ncbi:MAG: Bax inhibitor-1/YccA family protein [Candidatus Omnitrophica bacterium]|nr:Bax inhibitor-1/YccA family protein [Candidatus Omnitrophota bacterium]MDD4012830.1 Bax inhibitor-1/YccA family protein [Candidatus Omnitrophota bacterium]
MFKSGNPALKGDVFEREAGVIPADPMTIQGTVNKTLLSLALVVFGAFMVWMKPLVFTPMIWPAAIIGFIVAIATVFRKTWAPVTTPIYALVEGVVLGTISALLERSYPGIVMQAVALTFGTLFCLLLAYSSGLIKATENFKLGIVAATGAIALIYIVSMVLGLFKIQIPFVFGGGPLGILFSLFVVSIAALNLVIDFDFIETGAEAGAPKYMEWYGAFSLMITLVWLYMEILRLLAKTRQR